MEASTDAVNQVVEEFAGYPIAVVRTNDYFNTTNGISADFNHPNDTGHAQIAAAFLAAVRPIEFASPPPIGSATANTGAFTTLSAAGNTTVTNGTMRVSNNNSPTRLDVYNTFANTGNRNWSILNSQNVWGDMVIRISNAQNGDPVAAGTDILSLTSTQSKINTQFAPNTDNTLALGNGSSRWSTVYAGTGTINTSDEREKQQIKPIDGAALRAWAKVEYCQFKFNDAVEAKGDGARWHFGLIAQKVKEAFESEGLDAFTYGLLCYDEWADEYEDVFIVEEREVEETPVDGGDPIKRVEVTRTPTGEKQLVRAKGNRYGIRYEEALALECAYLRSKLGV